MSFFVMLFSELGPDPREIKSIGVEIQPKDGKIYFQQILRKRGLTHSTHPILNINHIFSLFH